MITEDEATRLLKRADPARLETRTTVVDAPVYLADLRKRSTSVTLTETPSTRTSPGGRHRWPIVALAAAAVVAIVVGALVLAARDDSGPVPANTTLTPTQPTDAVVPDTALAPDRTAEAEAVARAFADAFAAHDVERAVTYLADDVVTSVYGSVDGLRRELAWNAAARYEPTIGECSAQDGGTGADVTLSCAVSLQALGSDTLGLGPYPQGDFLPTVRDGKIVAISEGTAGPAVDVEVFEPFSSWINAEHPEDVEVMYPDENQTSWFHQTTDESIRLWQQRADEYVQFVLDARETYSADVAAICATQAQQLSQLGEPTEETADQLAAWSAAAAAIMQQAHDELTALTKPPSTDTVAYSAFYGNLNQLVRNLEDSAEVLTSAGSAEQDSLHADYLRIRGSMTSGPEDSGLEQCVGSLPSLTI